MQWSSSVEFLIHVQHHDHTFETKVSVQNVVGLMAQAPNSMYGPGGPCVPLLFTRRQECLMPLAA